MKVKQLCELLKTLPGDAPVFVRGYEGGVDDIERADPIRVKLNANDRWYYGAHEPTYPGDANWDAEGYQLVSE
jgi:hypothetical protein